MKITLDLPEDLLIEAMKMTHAKTRTQVIVTALRQLIRRIKIAELKQFKGSIDLDINLNDIRAR